MKIIDFRNYLFIPFCLLPSILLTQSWYTVPNPLAVGGQVGVGNPCSGCGEVYVLKSINNKLYIGGTFQFGNGFAIFNDSTWDSLGCGFFASPVESIEYYNGEIYAGGSF